mmetsp:Transcript_75725/g.204778  ORF Transcript_75725/g.204778 Transcript_75725/m.204778 type:complete len:378 (-) Transcript_75725:1978-3111(-)
MRSRWGRSMKRRRGRGAEGVERGRRCPRVFELLPLRPRRRHFRVHRQRHTELPAVDERVLHDVLHNQERLLAALFRALENELVVDAQHHLVPQAPQLLAQVGPDHRLVDDVRGAALDGRVDGLPPRRQALVLLGLLELPPVDPPPAEVAQLLLRHGHGEVLEPPVAAPQSADEGLEPQALPRCDALLDHAVLPGLDLWERLVPIVYRLLSLVLGDVQVLCQPVLCLAVRYSEVDGLCAFPLVREPILHQCHLVTHFAPHMLVHPPGGTRMDVRPRTQGLDHRRASRHVRQDPHLHLPIIGDYQLAAVRDPHGLADVVHVLAQSGDLLHVRIGAGQPTGGRPEVQGGVDAPVLVHVLLKRMQESADVLTDVLQAKNHA